MKKKQETNENKKSYVLLIIGVVALIAGLVFAVIQYNTSYQESQKIGEEITQIKDEIKTLDEDSPLLADLKAEQSKLSDEKLAAERPYSYGLVVIFLALAVCIKGLHSAVFGSKKEGKSAGQVQKLALAGLMAALCYIGFAFFKIDIPVGAEKTAFHLGNVFCVLAALLIGGYWGGLAGAIGMTIGDLTTAYVTSAPKTFLLKLLIGVIVGLVAHKLFHINETTSKTKLTVYTILSCVAGMGFNIVADPVVGYFYKTYLLGVPQDLAKSLAKIAAVTTAVNAVIAVIVATVFYLALRPALKKAGLLLTQEENS